jgi:hypothetical protein
MRASYTLLVCLVLILLTPRSSSAQGSIDGFGGLSLNQFSSVDGSALPFDFGGRVSIDLVPGIQAIGEFGRMGNVLPTITDLPVSLLPFDLRASAFYGEGGVRFVAAPHSAITPYAEASAGIARVSLTMGGLGPMADAVTRTALSLLDSTDPIAGFGGGVMFRGGPLLIDVGYRYKQIFSDSLVGAVLSAGQDLRSHQVRFGMGVRF